MGNKIRTFDISSDRYKGVGKRRRLKKDLNEAMESGLNTYIYDGDVAYKVSTNDHFTRRDTKKMLHNIGLAGQLYTVGTPEYKMNQDIGLKFGFAPMSYYVDSDDNGSYSMPQFDIEPVIPILNPLTPTYERPSDMPVFTGEPDYSHRNGPWIDVDAEERKVNNSDPAVISKRKAEEEAKRKAEEEAKRKAEEEAKRKAEEEAYATNHSFGQPASGTIAIKRTVIPVVKNKKTNTIISRGTPTTTWRFADLNMPNKIYSFWKGLGVLSSDRNIGDFIKRQTGYSGDISSIFNADPMNPALSHKHYFTNKNGDIFYDNLDGLTIWNNGRARYNGRMMSLKNALKSYILDKEKKQRDEQDEEDIDNYTPADSTVNDSIARTNYGDSLRRVTAAAMDSLRNVLYRPDSTVVRPDSTATR